MPETAQLPSTDPVPGADPAKALLAMIGELALELQPHRRLAPAVRLDSKLDRDLGFDSLARAELLLRLDRAFKVRLPEDLIAEAETAKDLLDAVLAAEPDRALLTEQTVVRPITPPEATEPVDAQTLIEALATHVAWHGEREHILLWRRSAEEDVITYAGLDRGARAVAGGLVGQGVEPGDRVAIMLPTEAGFFSAFFGALFAGAVPVPVYPPFRRAQLEEHLRRQAGILGNAEASILITNEEIHGAGELLYGLVASLRHIDLIGELERSAPIAEPFPAAADTTALIQYTSGSTGDPKGVVLSHANLMANIRAMGTALGGSAADTFVSWLPLYHDMGLIGAWLGCLYYGARTVIMPPLAFLADPGRWLWAIHRHRATLSAAPNFAFELCLKSIRDEDIAGLDLSSLRVVVNGAEPVSPSTIRRFAARFAPHGFRPEAMAPVYGLAECSVGLAFPPLGRAPVIDRVQRQPLALTGAALPVSPDDQSAIEFVACGQPLPGHQIRIIDDRGRELPERREGRLQFTGPSTTSGYFHDEERTRTLFDGSWLDSGDRAYVAAGDIYITGRVKDIIIRAGRNIYPHELEEMVGAIDGVRKGGVVAFASRDRQLGTEHLVVLAETRLTGEPNRGRLRQRIMEASAALLDLPPDAVVLVAPRTIPKTSSGKVRRSQARLLYESGSLGGKPRRLMWQIVRLALAGLLQRGRRWTWQAGEAAYAAWWWGLIGVMAIPVLLMVMVLPLRRWRHAVLGGAARLFFRLAGLSLTVQREAPSVPSRGAIIVANHASYLDGLVISAAIPGELSFAAKSEFSGQWIAGSFLRRLGSLFLRRADRLGGIEDTQVTVEAARAGERIVSFPEGTFTRMPGLLGFRLGAFLAAAEAQVPVIPVTIRGTRSILRGEQWFPRRGAIHVHIGRPLLPDGGDFDAALRLRNAARAAILARCGEPDLVREQVRPTS
jgi:1-acyl-sn-glycerol-3-phosphate acyltransferase